MTKITSYLKFSKNIILRNKMIFSLIFMALIFVIMGVSYLKHSYLKLNVQIKSTSIYDKNTIDSLLQSEQISLSYRIIQDDLIINKYIRPKDSIRSKDIIMKIIKLQKDQTLQRVSQIDSLCEKMIDELKVRRYQQQSYHHQNVNAILSLVSYYKQRISTYQIIDTNSTPEQQFINELVLQVPSINTTKILGKQLSSASIKKYKDKIKQIDNKILDYKYRLQREDILMNSMTKVDSTIIIPYQISDLKYIQHEILPQYLDHSVKSELTFSSPIPIRIRSLIEICIILFATFILLTILLSKEKK